LLKIFTIQTHNLLQNLNQPKNSNLSKLNQNLNRFKFTPEKNNKKHIKFAPEKNNKKNLAFLQATKNTSRIAATSSVIFCQQEKPANLWRF
jgi:uncharacterized protein with WD repeat